MSTPASASAIPDRVVSAGRWSPRPAGVVSGNSERNAASRRYVCADSLSPTSCCSHACLPVCMRVCGCVWLCTCEWPQICTTKCSKERNCGRHRCRKRCCVQCPPCRDTCGRRLACGNHKCESFCHAGKCNQCPKTVGVACACGTAVVTVPCGKERTTAPPACVLRCRQPTDCDHPVRQPHNCHFGACPPCTLPCGKPLPRCEHTCTAPCHPGSRCKPCGELVSRSCVGGHEERSMACHLPALFRCERPCGVPLACGRHTCEQRCHAVKYTEVDGERVATPCMECALPCAQPRACSHACALGKCHAGMLCCVWCGAWSARTPDTPIPVRVFTCTVGPCPPCTVDETRTCHCGAVAVTLPCPQWRQHEERGSLNDRLSCGAKCHRPSTTCPHLCTRKCHAGPCPHVDRCDKRVTVRCACGTVVEEWPCTRAQSVRAAQAPTASVDFVALLPCGDHCTVEEEAKTTAADESHDESKGEASLAGMCAWLVC